MRQDNQLNHEPFQEEEDNSSVNPFWNIVCGLGVMVGAVWLWFLFYDVEASNGTLRIHFLFAWLYNLGGKWLATSVLGCTGLILFGLGIRNIIRK